MLTPITELMHFQSSSYNEEYIKSSFVLQKSQTMKNKPIPPGLPQFGPPKVFALFPNAGTMKMGGGCPFLSPWLAKGDGRDLS